MAVRPFQKLSLGPTSTTIGTDRMVARQRAMTVVLGQSQEDGLPNPAQVLQPPAEGQSVSQDFVRLAESGLTPFLEDRILDTAELNSPKAMAWGR